MHFFLLHTIKTDKNLHSDEKSSTGEKKKFLVFAARKQFSLFKNIKSRLAVIDCIKKNVKRISRILAKKFFSNSFREIY